MKYIKCETIPQTSTKSNSHSKSCGHKVSETDIQTDRDVTKNLNHVAVWDYQCHSNTYS